MLQLQPAAGETSAVEALLDWYDLDLELILVLERPVLCMDLLDDRNSLGHHLPEDQAKVRSRHVLSLSFSVSLSTQYLTVSMSLSVSNRP